MKISTQLDAASLTLVFDHLQDKAEQLQSNMVRAVGQTIVSKAQATDKFQHGSSFQQGITFTATSPTSGTAQSQSFNSKGVEYSNFLEFGNQAVDGKKMTFQIDGQWITTYHRNPIGSEHLGFFSQAVEETNQEMQQLFVQEFNKLFT